MKMSLGHAGKRELFGEKEKPTAKVGGIAICDAEQEGRVLTLSSMNDYYMLLELDEWITGNYGEDFYAEENKEEESEEEDYE